MKLILALCFCGVVTGVCCFPSCSINEYRACNKRNNTLIQTEEDVDVYCREIECMLEFNNNCGTKVTGTSKGAREHFDNIYGLLCFKKHATRQEFIDNAHCLNEVTKTVSTFCRIDAIGLNHEQFCQKLPATLQCADVIVTQECGKVASNVFLRIYPGYEYYECEYKESYDDYRIDEEDKI